MSLFEEVNTLLTMDWSLEPQARRAAQTGDTSATATEIWGVLAANFEGVGRALRRITDELDRVDLTKLQRGELVSAVGVLSKSYVDAANCIREVAVSIDNVR